MLSLPSGQEGLRQDLALLSPSLPPLPTSPLSMLPSPTLPPLPPPLPILPSPMLLS